MKLKKLTIEEILYTEVTKNINDHKKLVLAFSGGLDSTVLLEILHNINNYIHLKKNNKEKLYTLRAIHIHHGLSHKSDYWAQHCAQECSKRNIPFKLIYASFKKKNLGGIENTARQIRYHHLFNNLHEKEILLTAQHLDDQSETFLLALKRGSGPKGLSGMPTNFFFNKRQLLRPLLKCSRKQIKKYAHIKQLLWITDTSNLETRFDRNFLRLKILPILKNRWPKINYTIARSAKLCADQEILLDELLQEEFKKLYCHDHSLLLKPLITMTTQKRQALLRRWLNTFNIQMPSYKKLYHIWKNVILSKKDTTPILQLNKQFLLRRFKNKLHILPNIIQLPLHNTTIHWHDIHKKIFLPHQLGVLIAIKFSNTEINLFNKKDSLNTIKQSQNMLPLNVYNNIINKTSNLFLIRTPHEKEKITIKFEYTHHKKIHIIGKSHSKTIKKIWKEFEIPPWIRKKTPLLFYDNKLITALGVFVTQDGKFEEEKAALGIYWLK